VRGEGIWDDYFKTTLECAEEERVHVVLYSPAPQSCCICRKELGTDTAWHSSLEARCCPACADTCPRCLRADTSFPTADNPAFAGTAADDAGTGGSDNRCVLFRASFLAFEEEKAPEKPAWRSEGCANCDACGTHQVHSAVLHIGDRSLPGWTRSRLEQGERDAHMSCSSLATTVLGRCGSGKRRLEMAAVALEEAETMSGEEVEAARARLEEERDLFRSHVHVIKCKRQGPHVVHLSNWLERARAFGALPHDASPSDDPDWTEVAAWAERCKIRDLLRYSIQWGDNLSEVLLRRDMLDEAHVEATTVPLAALDEDLAWRCLESYGGGWCRSCSETLEEQARAELQALAEDGRAQERGGGSNKE
jgi:hypothetical protein